MHYWGIKVMRCHTFLTIKQGHKNEDSSYNVHEYCKLLGGLEFITFCSSGKCAAMKLVVHLLQLPPTPTPTKHFWLSLGCETAHYCLQRQNSPIGCIHINPEQSGHKFSIDKMYKRIPQQSELHPLGFVVLVSPLVPQQWSALKEKWNITQQGARKSFMYSASTCGQWSEKNWTSLPPNRLEPT
jgi:hypothetical protein